MGYNADVGIGFLVIIMAMLIVGMTCIWLVIRWVGRYWIDPWAKRYSNQDPDIRHGEWGSRTPDDL